MAETINNIITHKDRRTGKNYACRYSGEHKDIVLKNMMDKAEYDYVQSLPAEKRAELKHQDTDFKCPFCHSKKEPTMRIETVVSGFLIFFSTRLVDIYKCRDCDKEFQAYQLHNEIKCMKDVNYQNECFEKFRDGKISELQFKEMCGLLVKANSF